MTDHIEGNVTAPPLPPMGDAASIEGEGSTLHPHYRKGTVEMLGLIAATPGAVDALTPKPSTRTHRWDESKHTNARAIARRKRQMARGALKVEEEAR